MYYRMPLPVATQKQFLIGFLQPGEGPRPFCCMPDFDVVAASGAEGCH